MKYVRPHDLLTTSRFDLFARTNFVRSELQGFGHSWGRSVYRDFILTTSKDNSGKEEWGEDNSKFSLKDYERSFRNLISSIEENGYLEKFGAIPLSNGIITNGAHRLAVCLITDNNIPVENQSLLECPNYDYKWLISKGMTSLHLDQMALDFVRVSQNCRALVFFGQDDKTMDEIFKYQDSDPLHEIIYNKKVNLSDIGIRRVVQVCYQMNNWWEESYLEKMYLERFENRNKSIYISIIKTHNQEKFIQYKNYLRDTFCSQEFERTIHGTDEAGDTFEVLSTLLNQNGLFFVNNAPIGSESRIINLLRNEASIIKSEDYAIDGSASKEMLGRGIAQDIDYISLINSGKINLKKKIFDDHEKFYHGLPLDFREVIFDPRLHFTWGGFKFVTKNAADFLRSESIMKSEMKLSSGGIYINSAGYVRARMSKFDYSIGKLRIMISPFIPKFIKSIIRNLRD